MLLLRLCTYCGGGKKKRIKKALAAYSPLANPTEMERRHIARFCGPENCVHRLPAYNRRGRHGSATIVWPIPEMCHNRPRWASTANSLATTLGLSCPNPTVVLQRCNCIDCCLWPTRRGCFFSNVTNKKFLINGSHKCCYYSHCDSTFTSFHDDWMARAASYRWPPAKKKRVKSISRWQTNIRGIQLMCSRSLARKSFISCMCLCVCVCEAGGALTCAPLTPAPKTVGNFVLWARESETTREQVLQLIARIWNVGRPPARPPLRPIVSQSNVWKCMTLDLEKTHI